MEKKENQQENMLILMGLLEKNKEENLPKTVRPSPL